MTGTQPNPPSSAPPEAAPELVEAGYAWENADAPLLHHGLNLPDIAHVLGLRTGRIIAAELVATARRKAGRA